jgi:putative membrane protein (TIGR04086 family)
MIAFLVLGITGVVDSPSDAVPLIFLQFLGLLTAGYVAGRLAGRDRVVHGGFAGLAVFAVATVITLAAGSDSASPLVVAFTGVLAAVLGSAGGALAQVRGE